MLATPIYLDHMATTPVDPRVLEAMLPYFSTHFGNAASRAHAFGWVAAEAVERARAQVASLLGAASPQEIVFTSGATESNNLAIKGVAAAYRERGKHLITCATEHKAVLDCFHSLERQGYQVTRVPVDRFGVVELEPLESALTEQTILVSIMAANNEIGTVQPLGHIGELARSRGVLWHCDAAQAAGKIPLDVGELGVDLLSVSGHKVYGPKGVGALYVRTRRPRLRLQPQLEGGGQERGLRSGTLNVPGIVGLGRACELCQQEREQEAERLARLRGRLYHGIADQVEGVVRNGHPQECLPGNLHLSFTGIDGSALLLALRELALSSGSACTSGAVSPSHVLKAIGVPDELGQSSLRFGLGRSTTAEEIEYTAGRVVEEVERLRAAAPVLPPALVDG